MSSETPQDRQTPPVLLLSIRRDDAGIDRVFLLAALSLEVIRKELTPEVTLGELYLDGEFFCFTLEDTVRDCKVPGETAIPEGSYEVLVTNSPRFKRKLPLLINVPGFDGIRIHPGNSAEDTSGCLLVGEEIDRSTPIPTLRKSRQAFDRLFPILQEAPNVTISVRCADDA